MEKKWLMNPVDKVILEAEYEARVEPTTKDFIEYLKLRHRQQFTSFDRKMGPQIFQINERVVAGVNLLIGISKQINFRTRLV